MKTSILIIACLVLGTALLAKDNPNFIVIVVDDLGYGDIGSYHDIEGYSTPHLDRMADEGMQFTDFLAAHSLCTPSRAAMQTGRYPERWGYDGGVYFPHSSDGMPSSERTVAEILGEAGYATALFGKWHLGHLPEFLPTAQGYDTFYGIPYSNDMAHDGDMPLAEDIVFREGRTLEDYREYRPHTFGRKGGIHRQYKGQVPLVSGKEVVAWPADQSRFTSDFTEKTIAFIEENKDRPFFICLAHPMPHIPLYASEQFAGTTEPGTYGDVVRELDATTGEILAALVELGLDQETLVLFTSDNGPWLNKGENGGSAGILRDGKGSSYEGGQRVPGIFWWPGTIPAGVTTSFPVNQMDLLPTMVALSSAELPNDRIIDGMDISGVLTGMEKTEHPERIFRYMDGEAVRVGEWKYRVGKLYGRWSGKEGIQDNNPQVEQLFNLTRDPGERNNLLDEGKQAEPDSLHGFLESLKAAVNASVHTDRGGAN